MHGNVNIKCCAQSPLHSLSDKLTEYPEYTNSRKKTIKYSIKFATKTQSTITRDKEISVFYRLLCVYMTQATGIMVLQRVTGSCCFEEVECLHLQGSTVTHYRTSCSRTEGFLTFLFVLSLRYFHLPASYIQTFFRNCFPHAFEMSSSPYICHGFGPPVDPFWSHASRSLFKGLP
jgi:hypothetical protein